MKLSIDAIGVHPQLRLINSMSLRSTSRTTRIFSRARKCSATSDTASRRIDFWISSTLQPVFLICMHILRRYSRSSRTTRSICV